jgi:signal recognition particle subunit SRP54
MHVDSAMLQELQAIDMAIEPQYKILILDSMTGQESLAVAQAFDQAVGFCGAILTKTDSDSRGGAAFAFRFALKKPILFVSHGEKIDDLSLFHPQRAVSRMLGMGDIQTLVERANEKIQQEEQEAAYKAFTSGKLTLEDFAKHMDMMNKLGSLSSIMKFLPGVPAQMLSDDAMAKGELQMKKFRAIIGSMTRKERLNPAVFDKSRKERVANGAGVHVQDIQDLLQRFKEMQQYVKIFSNPGLMKRFFR